MMLRAAFLAGLLLSPPALADAGYDSCVAGLAPWLYWSGETDGTWTGSCNGGGNCDNITAPAGVTATWGVSLGTNAAHVTGANASGTMPFLTNNITNFICVFGCPDTADFQPGVYTYNVWINGGSGTLQYALGIDGNPAQYFTFPGIAVNDPGSAMQYTGSPPGFRPGCGTGQLSAWETGDAIAGYYWYQACSSGRVDDGAGHMVTLIGNGTDVFTLFVDGVAQPFGSSAKSSTVTGWSNFVSGPYPLFELEAWATRTTEVQGSNPWVGTVGGMSVWTVQLGQAQVQKLYNAGRYGVCSSTLEAGDDSGEIMN
jgi:hypothetical protein